MLQDPTLINNSYGSFSSTGNLSGQTYTIGYRGNTQTYTGTGSHTTVPTNSGGARCRTGHIYIILVYQVNFFIF